MSAYMIAQVRVNDPDQYKKYLAGFAPNFERHGGQLLVTSSFETEMIEGNGPFRAR
ncbi:MAG: DUF1330 domain-containing protein [Alphaproteobacteria bacterium]|nr:DUF1330 domain-containing protein [Alphaproteobacteria bacterium]